MLSLFACGLLLACAAASPDVDTIVAEAEWTPAPVLLEAAVEEEQSVEQRADSDVIQAMCGLRAYSLLAAGDAREMTKPSSTVYMVTLFGSPTSKKESYNVITDFSQAMQKTQTQYPHGMGEYMWKSLNNGIFQKSKCDYDGTPCSPQWSLFELKGNPHSDKIVDKKVIFNAKRLGMTATPGYFFKLGVNRKKWDAAYTKCQDSVAALDTKKDKTPAGVSSVRTAIYKAFGATAAITDRAEAILGRKKATEAQKVSQYHKQLATKILTGLNGTASKNTGGDPLARIKALSEQALSGGKAAATTTAAPALKTADALKNEAKATATSEVKERTATMTVKQVTTGIIAVGKKDDKAVATECAQEGGTCQCKGSVRYGKDTRWAKAKKAAGSIRCVNSIFGDPAPGTRKVCMCTPGTFDADGSKECAKEHGTCKCTGTVKYGVDSRWVSKTVSGSIACSNRVFGDPASGTRKSCHCTPGTGMKEVKAAASSPPQEIECAKEHGTCKCTGTVKYGVDSRWVSKTASGSIACSNGVFGDPARGTKKSCVCETQKAPTTTGSSTTSSSSTTSTTTSMVPTAAPKELKRFTHKTHSKSHHEAYAQATAFCKSKGGHLPTLNEICPKGEGKGPPALGCVSGGHHSWVPYSKNSDSWVFIACGGHGGKLCKDHVKHHGSPNWAGGDVYGDEIECMA